MRPNVNLCVCVVLQFGAALLWLGCQRPADAQPNTGAGDMQHLFEARYRAWLCYIGDDSNVPDVVGDPARDEWPLHVEPYRQIVALGVPAVPFVVAQITADDSLFSAALQIMKMEFHWHPTDATMRQWTIDEWPGMGKLPHPRDNDRIVWRCWWKTGRFQAGVRLAALYSEWQTLKHQGREDEATAKWERIKGLGIAALPRLVEKVGRGEADLIPIMSYWTDGAVKADARPADCVAWWGQHKRDWTLPAKTDLPAPVEVKYDRSGRLGPGE